MPNQNDVHLLQLKSLSIKGRKENRLINFCFMPWIGVNQYASMLPITATPIKFTRFTSIIF